MNRPGVGFTLGYQINDNLSLTPGYMARVNDSDHGDFQMDGFRLSLTYGWHCIVEGRKRLKSGECPARPSPGAPNQHPHRPAGRPWQESTMAGGELVPPLAGEMAV